MNWNSYLVLVTEGRSNSTYKIENVDSGSRNSTVYCVYHGIPWYVYRICGSRFPVLFDFHFQAFPARFHVLQVLSSEGWNVHHASYRAITNHSSKQFLHSATLLSVQLLKLRGIMSNLLQLLKFYSSKLDARTICLCSPEGSELLTGKNHSAWHIMSTMDLFPLPRFLMRGPLLI